MKKVLMAFSGADFSRGAFEFARQLNEISPILLSGFFLPEIGTPAYELHVSDPSVEDEGEKIMEANIGRFTELCEKNKIEYNVHIGTYELCMPQLLKKTRFSDLFIASSEIFYRSFDHEDTHYYLNKALHQSECPLIVVTEEFEFPENVVLAYDGSASSVYAIKQFTYLFPEFCRKNALVVYAKNKTDKSIPMKTEIEDFIAVHFGKVEYVAPATSPGKYFNAWLVNKKKTLLVAGAYGRSGLSELIKKSFVHEVIEERIAPVFIAHA